MCFAAFTTAERCERCGHVHPAGLEQRCIEIAAADAALGLDADLECYLASAEARFFAYLARQRAA